MNYLILFCIFLAGSFSGHQPEQVALTDGQQLIVFLQAEKDLHFKSVCLPKLEAYALNKKIDLIVRHAEEGLPELITTTPAIVYQNALGRSIYAGRYTEFSTIENFIRTSRMMPQQYANLCKTDILSKEVGRARILAPLKITRLEGKRPADWEQAQFEVMAKKTLTKAMSGFTQQEESCIRKTDRQFYLDIYPYLDEDGLLYLSLALFSQFNCIKPVFTTGNKPLQGQLEKAAELFYQAGQLFEQEITRQLQTSETGDALSPVPKEIPFKCWEALGLLLPEAERQFSELEAGQSIPIKMPNKWQFFQALEADLPVLQFQFMKPLERYSGEVRKVDGRLEMDGAENVFSGAFEVETGSLTMGIADFDRKIHKKYIKAFRFPKAGFEFETDLSATTLQWEDESAFRIPGIFQLIKYKKPVTIDAQLTPVLSEIGEPLLVVNARFELNITDDFNIEGPDGPDPARKTMIFAANFLMNSPDF